MPKYFLRFDDFQPFMNWKRWSVVEAVLNKHNLKVCIAVIPNNQDDNLYHGNVKEDFWAYLRSLQKDGHTIALHGETHVYRNIQQRNLLPIKKGESEFTGLSLEEQTLKIRRGLDVLRSNSLETKLFIAPGHAFDDNTLRALKTNHVEALSDGFFYKPVFYKDVYWIPCQMWRFHKMPFGEWTLCCHSDSMSEQDIDILDQMITENRRLFHDFNYGEMVGKSTKAGVFDLVWAFLWGQMICCKQKFRKWW